MKRTIPALLIVLASGTPAFARQMPDTSELVAAQREATSRMSFLDGVWRGPGWIIGPGGERVDFVQTERVGTMLDGTIRVIEGRAWVPSGESAFNAFAVLTFDPQSGTYRMQSWTDGRQGSFEVTLLESGFAWSIQAGRATIRYEAAVADGRWTETGTRQIGDDDPVPFLHFELERVGDTDWPAAGAVSAQ